MTNEIIENIYFRYIDGWIKYIAIKTNEKTYSVVPNGFVGTNTDIKDYVVDTGNNLSGKTILKVGSSGGAVLIELPDRRFIFIDPAGSDGNLDFALISSDEYDYFNTFFEEHMQLLSKEKTFAIQDGNG